MLLRFRVSNYRSVNEPVELSLVSSRMQGVVPKDGDWHAVVSPVTAIYGPNGSGKSTLLRAFEFFRDAVRSSATTWGSTDGFPHYPFRLDRRCRTEPSLFEVDLVLDGTRYTYGFEATARRVESEWLYSYPEKRRRVLFERDADEDEIFFGRHLTGANATISRLTRPNALYLSTGANNNHQFLTQLRRRIVQHYGHATFDEVDRDSRLRQAREVLEEDTELRRDADALLRFADLGISGVELHEIEATAQFGGLTAGDLGTLMHRAMNEGVTEVSDIRRMVAEHRKIIKFSHRGADQTDQLFEMSDESSGTVAWLSLVVPALMALKRGDLLAVDEIDSSLHPMLTAALIQLFRDPSRNPRGAQLVFTSHDTALMGRLLGDVLERDEVWFTEKGDDGATKLYSLADFYVRSVENIEKRYLEGRYGALPIVRRNELSDLLDRKSIS